MQKINLHTFKAFLAVNINIRFSTTFSLCLCLETCRHVSIMKLDIEIKVSEYHFKCNSVQRILIRMETKFSSCSKKSVV